MYAQEADHLLIPLLDGAYTLAQVARVEGDLARLFITSRRMTRASEVFPFGIRDIKAALVTDIGAVPHDHWEVAGYETIPDLPRLSTPMAEATIHDPSVVEAFANALHGLYPWDGYPDPDFFTSLLRTPEVRPSRARTAAQMPALDTE